MGLFPRIKITAVATVSLVVFSANAFAQNTSTSASNNDDLFNYGEEEIFIVGATRAPDEKLVIDKDAEKHLSEIPETKDKAADKDAALLDFALNGIDSKSEAATEKVNTEQKKD